MLAFPSTDSMLVETGTNRPQLRSSPVCFLKGKIEPETGISLLNFDVFVPPNEAKQEDRDPVTDAVLAQGDVLIDQTLHLLLHGTVPEPKDLYICGMKQVSPFSPVSKKSNLADLFEAAPEASITYMLDPVLGVSERSSTSSTSHKSNSGSKDDSAILKRLGATLYCRGDPYVDASRLRDPGLPPASRGGHSDLFPSKLHRMLSNDEYSDVVSFLGHGRAFAVHDVNRFLKEVAPQYFKNQSRWNSFCKQLHLYGFARVKAGKDEGAFYHPLCIRGLPLLVRYMRRVNGKREALVRAKEDAADPDFYAMPSIMGEEVEPDYLF